MTTCSYCGNELAPDDRFCQVCGRRTIRSLDKRPRRRPVRAAFWRKPVAWVGAAGVLLLVVALVLALGGDPSPVGESDTVAGDVPYPNVARISLAEAKEKHDSDSAVFLDVRSAGEYQAGHVSGSLSFPLGDLAARLDELPRGKEIITYCA
jgi:hypothetical protein